MFQTTKDKSANDHLENAASDFKSGKNELKKAGKKAYASANNATEGTVEYLREQAREVGEKVQHYLHDGREQIMDAKVAAERTIRANPLQSAAVAALGGFILARLLRR